MQKITYKTVNSPSVTITDDNTSKTSNGIHLPFHLLEFDGDSQSSRLESYERVGKDGAGIYGAKILPKAIMLKIAVLPEDGKESTMREYRRKLLSAFPLGEEGILTYENSTGKYEINCFVSDSPPVSPVVGRLCEATFYLTASLPFWRKPADDISLTATTELQSMVFTADTEYKVPACLVVSCGGNMAGTKTHSAEITLISTQRNPMYSHITLAGSKSFSASTSQKQSTLYLTEYMTADDKLMVDWGIVNRFYMDKTKYSYIDFIKSEPQYVYPGINTLTIKPNFTSGSLTVTIRRYDYVRSVG